MKTFPLRPTFGPRAVVAPIRLLRALSAAAAAVLLASLTACSGAVQGIGDGLTGSAPSPDSAATTSTAATPTVAGVCAKYDELTCAEANCIADLTEAQEACGSSDAFQAMLDCLATATIVCAGSPASPTVPQCTSQILAASSCAGVTSSGSSSTTVSIPGGGSTTVDAGTVSVPTPDGCQTDGECTSWPCMCTDGYEVDLGVCSSGVCQGPVYVCSSANASAVDACAAHGGLL